MERLQKVIANNGYCSRRKAEELIKLGKVKVNNETVYELGTQVSDDDLIEVEGYVIKKEDKVYILHNSKYYSLKIYTLDDLLKEVDEEMNKSI